MRYGKRYKVVTWSSYRKIPNYEKVLEKMASERDQILSFISSTLLTRPSTAEVESEIGEIAGRLSIPFDEALYYKWNYCQKIHEATERIKAVHPEKL